jgi:hypothetical protein
MGAWWDRKAEKPLNDVTPDGYWSVVSILGRLDPDDASIDRAAATLDGLDSAELFRQIVDNRVYTLAQRHLERIAPAKGCGAQALTMLQDLESEETERRRRARPETLAILHGAEKFGVRIIKGLALREWYADPRARHEGDADLHVPDWAAGLALAVWLRGRGWCWDTHEFPWIKWSDSGHLYGQLSLVYPGNADAFARADLHIGPFSVGHAGLLPMVGWERGTVLGIPAVVPDAEMTIALITAHAVNDGLLSMKDVNDLHVLLTRRRVPDWASVEELCRGFGGTAVLRHLLAVIATIYPRTQAPAEAESVLATVVQQGDVRADRFAALALRDELTRGAAPGDAAAVAQEARRYFSADLKPRLTCEVIAGPGDGERSRNKCWRLLPREVWSALGDPTEPAGHRVAEEIAPGLTLVRRGAGVALVTAGESFVPTVWGGVHAQSLALAATEAGK